MTDTLNPEALKFHRKRRGNWSQDRLAAESRISKTQISRWERGQQVDNIRPSSRERLCKALGVKWDELTHLPKQEDISILLNRFPLKGDIDGTARTFLRFVQLRFGLNDDAIMDLAPLAVLILAEHSLRARRIALNETEAALDAATTEAHRRLPYLPGASPNGCFDWLNEETRSWLTEETESIERRNLFPSYLDYRGNEHRPFVNFLRDEVQALGLFGEHPIEFTSSYPWVAPEYVIPAPLLGQIVGLDPDQETDRGTLEWIQNGGIDLREVWEKKEAVGEEDYRLWLEEKYQASTEEKAQLLNNFDL